MKERRKPFSILKWLVFPSLTLALASIIAWFNISAFGWQDGAVYVGVVAVITAFSIAINKYVKLIDDDDESNDRLAIAAFVFEIVLTLILAVNAAYSLSVQREMSIARQTETHQSQDLETVSKLKDRRAQREAVTMLREQSKGARSAQTIFAENERPLFYIMLGEMLVYIIAAFTLYATAQLMTTRSRRAKAYSTSTPVKEEASEDFPKELDANVRAEPKEPRLTAPTTQQKQRHNVSLKSDDTDALKGTTLATTQSDAGDGLKRLRECLKLISFHNPGVHFKADAKDDCVWIRAMRSEHGEQRTIASTKSALSILDDVLTMEPEAFRNRLERFLKSKGFPIGGAMV